MSALDNIDKTDYQSPFIDFNIRTYEYELKNDKKVFARIERDFVTAWCKENGFPDWDCPEDSGVPRSYYVRLFFALVVFDGLDLNAMTDAYVVGKALGFK